jgi:hypothetical protein
VEDYLDLQLLHTGLDGELAALRRPAEPGKHAGSCAGPPLTKGLLRLSLPCFFLLKLLVIETIAASTKMMGQKRLQQVSDGHAEREKKLGSANADSNS